MIKIKRNKDSFLNFLEVLKNLNRDIVIEFKNEGIFIKLIDLSNVSVSKLSLKKSFFDIYELEKELKIMLNGELLLNLISNLEEINIKIDENKIICNDCKHEFELNYFASEEDERNIGDILFNTEFNLDSKDFFLIIKMYESFDDCYIYNEDSKLYLSISTDFIKTKSIIKSQFINGSNSKANYSIRYLNHVSYLKEVFDSIKFSYGENLMSRMEGKNEECEFSYYLAPRSL